MVDKYLLDRMHVERRIDWAIKASYIYSGVPEYIYPHERVTFEMPFLELLANEFRSKVSMSDEVS